MLDVGVEGLVLLVVGSKLFLVKLPLFDTLDPDVLTPPVLVQTVRIVHTLPTPTANNLSPHPTTTANTRLGGRNSLHWWRRLKMPNNITTVTGH